MEKDSGRAITELRVDGTSATYDFFMQMQTDILQYPVMRPKVMPASATGAAYLAGLATGFWTLQEIREQYTIARVFSPEIPADSKLREKWQKAIARVKNWDL
jgi:glycerol kinase